MLIQPIDSSTDISFVWMVLFCFIFINELICLYIFIICFVFDEDLLFCISQADARCNSYCLCKTAALILVCLKYLRAVFILLFMSKMVTYFMGFGGIKFSWSCTICLA